MTPRESVRLKTITRTLQSSYSTPVLLPALVWLLVLLLLLLLLLLAALHVNSPSGHHQQGLSAERNVDVQDM